MNTIQECFLCINSWAGRREYSVVIIDETPKKYKIRLVVDTKLPGRNRYGNAGEIILVPKTAVKIKDMQ